MADWYYIDSWDWHGTIGGADRVFATAAVLDDVEAQQLHFKLDQNLPRNTNRGFVWKSGAWRPVWTTPGDMPRDVNPPDMPAPSHSPIPPTVAFGALAAVSFGLTASVLGALLAGEGKRGEGAAIGAGAGALVGAAVGVGSALWMENRIAHMFDTSPAPALPAGSP